MKYTLYTILGGLFFLSACSTVKMDSPEEATKLVEFAKSACYGDCPSYHMIVKTDGSVIYTGRRKVDRMGIHTAQLDKKAYKDLVTSLKSADLYALENSYNDDIADGSVTRITYFGEKGTKKIKTIFTFPGSLQSISDKLTSIAEKKTGWTKEEIDELDKDVIVKQDKPTQKVFSYSQGACFGQCPVYTINVFSDRSLLLIGKQFSDKTGIYVNSLSEKEYHALYELISSPEFVNLEEKYDTDIMDAQTFTMEFYDTNRKMKSVSTKITFAPITETIVEVMQDLYDKKGWEVKEGDDSKPTSNTILISLSPDIEAKTWIRSKRHLGAKIERFLSPNGTYFLISVDEDKDMDRVMEELRRDKYVLAVDSGDRPAKPRRTTENKHGKATIKKGGE